MSLSINAKTYTADKILGDSVTYAGPNNTLSVKDQAKLSRVPAKPTTLFSGVARVDAKLTRTLTLTGALTPSHDLIAQVPISVPVGAASADIDTALNDLGAFVASATFKDFVKKQAINF